MKKILKFIPITLLTVALVWIVALRAQIAQSEPWAMAPPEVDMGGIVTVQKLAAVEESSATDREIRQVEGPETEVVIDAYELPADESGRLPTPADESGRLPTPATAATAATPTAEADYPARYSDYDVEVMAIMLAGECYPWDTADMRNAAITVCNRVDNSAWPQTSVASVIIETGYYGYGAHNTPTETHYSVAREALDDWSARSAGIDRPWQPWLFFSAVNGVNVYRVVY